MIAPRATKQQHTKTETTTVRKNRHNRDGLADACPSVLCVAGVGIGLLTVGFSADRGSVCNAWSGGNLMSEQSERSNPDECEEQNAPPIEYADT
ncbi:hypothetical protein GmarT_02070 [Gimesia maris]|uniref:Uncharacterized protein n=1 Tax=Gimesia maris TaxID=122 RepID=A0ABX5YF89_9PLAN|nr:hypothetical protein GmarT_02070 [Gimesia maris]